MIQRYEPDIVSAGGPYYVAKMCEADCGEWVLHSDHAAEVARLSARSAAVARLVEACKTLRSWPQAHREWPIARDEFNAALAAVEKEMQP